MKVDDHDHSIQDMVNKLNALDEYASNLPASERKHLASGMAEIAAIIRRLRDDTSTSSAEPNDIQRGTDSVPINQSINPSPFGKETVQALLDTVEAFAFLVLPDGTVSAVNKWVTRMVGKPESELIGKSASMGLSADIAELRKEKIQEVFKTGKPLCFEDSDNGLIFQHSLYPILDQKGNVMQVAIMGLDITNYKNVKEDLKVSETRLRAIYTDASDIIIYLDKSGTLLNINKSTIFGHERSDLIGKKFYDLDIINPLDIPVLIKIYQDIMAGGTQLKCFEFEIFDSDDNPVYLEATARMSRQMSKTEGIVTVIRDITERKKSEQALQESEARFRAIFETAQDSIFIKNMNLEYIQVNPAMERLFGLPALELVGKTDPELFGPEEGARIRKTDKRVLKGEIIEEEDVKSVDGISHTFHYVKVPIRDEKGKISGLCGISRDITKRKCDEEALQKNRELLEHAVAGSHGGEWELEFDSANRKGSMPDKIYLSPRLKKMIGFKDDELPNSVKAWRARILPEDLKKLKKLSRDHLQGESELFETDYRIRHKDGSLRWMSSRGRILRNEQGLPLRWTGIDWDITERKQAEEILRESEKKYREIFELAPVGIYEIDKTGVITFANRKVSEYFGYSREEFRGKIRALDLFSAADHSKAGANFERVIRGENIGGNEYRVIRKDGSEFFASIHSIAIERDGQITGVRGVIADITPLKEAEQALRRSENTLRGILAATPIGIGMVKNRIISWSNERISEMVGYSEKELIGQNARLLYETDEEYERVGREKYADIEKYGIGTIETRWKCKDGQIIDILLSSSPLDRSDLSAGVIFTAMDITERKQAEEQLRMMQFAVDHSSDVAHWMDKDANFVYVNNSACKVLGYTHEELGKMSVFDIDPDFTRDMWSEAWRLIKQNGSLIIESRHVTKDGKTFPVEIAANYMNFGGVEYDCAFARDITERKAAERELEKSREVYRALTENSPDVIVRFDRQMKCVYANRACGSVLSLYPDEVVGSRPTEMNFDKNKAKKIEDCIRQVISTGKPFQADVELDGKQGELIFDWRMIPEFTSSGEVETVLAIGRDITETIRLQEFTARAMRLETAGRIAGQVAHDFNNLLGPLMAYPDLITDTLPPQHEALPLIDDMKRAAEQIAEINQQLLTLGRRGHYNLQPLNLNELIDQIVGDIFPVPDTLVIEKKLAANLMNINAGKSQILRALFNLISNARDAMQDIGYLTITTENLYVADTARGYGRIPPGEYVKLTISDTGNGMSEDVLARIFEPFYSTKTATRKRGSGLGLSVVHAVIEDHNGYIDCESTIGEGTSMYLYIPITREEMEKTQSDRIITGSESILVVDDDNIQRDVALTLLKRLGYDAAAVESGEKALRLLSKKRFDLLILDMVMPGGLDGTATYMEALKINPDQKAIIVSGYAESERVNLALNLGIDAFYKKPLMLKTLSHAIRQELDKPINQPKST